MEQYILSLDQGTSSSRAIVFDRKGQICSMAQREFTQIFPKPGWVEHNPHEIWSSQASVIAEAIAAIDINGLNIAGIGITNQRETTIVWDSETEEPVYNAIVWQDRRTSEYCDRLKAEGQTEFIRERTGLIVDAYFSATKIKWILDNVAGARERAEKGKLMFGTVDSWLIWRLTRGEVHVTDVSNASRTMLFNIHTLQWDEELLRLFGIPASMMPQVKSSSEVYGATKTTIFAHKVPIAGIAGDQQAALFGQMCVEPGSVKNTYGTVDSWLIWRLTRGEVHVTDVSNASRTMLFNIHTLQWDEELLRLFGIPASMMPQVKSSSEVYGATKTTIFAHKVPIAGIAGDQQAALFGQMCVEPGSVKNTYGTGCFLLMNSGEKPITSSNNLLTTIAWKIGDKVDYALEGSIFVGGSVVQWLRDGLGIIRSSSEVEALAASVPDTNGVYFVPALTGLAAPYWDQYARGAISGISRGTTAAHIARAALEGIAYQTLDIVGAMQRDSGITLRELKVDGGAARNNLLMQFQSDLLDTRVIRPGVTETTALGAAYLAGLAVGYWGSIDEIRQQWQAEHVFEPTADRSQIGKAVAGWEDAVRRVLRNSKD